jgi:hypothetical protein
MNNEDIISDGDDYEESDEFQLSRSPGKSAAGNKSALAGLKPPVMQPTESEEEESAEEIQFIDNGNVVR